MAESYVTGCDVYSRFLYLQGQGFVTVPGTIYYPVSIDAFNGSLVDTIDYLEYLATLRSSYDGEGFDATVYMNYAAPVHIPPLVR